MKRISRNQLIICVSVILIGIIGSLGYYRLYYVRTPEYTLKIIQSAVKNHDVYTVRKHIDINSIVNSYVDTYVDSEIKKSNLKNNPFSSALAPLAKNILKTAIPHMIDDAILGKNDSDKEDATNKDKIPIENTIDNKKDIQIDRITSAKIDDNTSEIDIQLKNTKKHTDIDLKLKAQKLDDGTWKIFEISNLEDLDKL